MRRNAHEVLCEKKAVYKLMYNIFLILLKKKKKKQVHKEMTRRKCTKL